MNQEIPVTNNGKTTIYVGGRAIIPGETRCLPAHEVPAYLHPQAPEAQLDSPPDVDADLGRILKCNVREVTAALPNLSDDHLALLARFEDKDHGGAGRKTVLEAIAAEQLGRADRAHLAEFADSLTGLDEDALLAKLDEAGTDLDKADLVQAALEALHPGADDGEPSTS